MFNLFTLTTRPTRRWSKSFVLVAFRSLTTLNDLPSIRPKLIAVVMLLLHPRLRNILLLSSFIDIVVILRTTGDPLKCFRLRSRRIVLRNVINFLATEVACALVLVRSMLVLISKACLFNSLKLSIDCKSCLTKCRTLRAWFDSPTSLWSRCRGAVLGNT